ncbi:MAG: hypothetical protein ABI462_04965 [Ignavibacteria bacterium]
MNESRKSKVVSANSEAELSVIVQTEIVEQGWQADGGVIKNSDGTFSQKLVK